MKKNIAKSEVEQTFNATVVGEHCGFFIIETPNWYFNHKERRWEPKHELVDKSNGVLYGNGWEDIETAKHVAASLRHKIA